MADLTDLQAAQTIKIVGADSSGLETNAVGADANGNLQVRTSGFSTPSNTIPTVTTTNSVILAANVNRRYAYINNQSGSTIYIKLGAAAVVGQGIKLTNDTMYEITADNLWLGTVNAIANAGSHGIDVFEGT